MFNKLKKKASLRAQSFKSSKGSYSFNDSVDDGGLSVIPHQKKRSSLAAIIATNEETTEENLPRVKPDANSTPQQYITDGTLSNEKLQVQKNARFSSFFEPTSPVTSSSVVSDKTGTTGTSHLNDTSNGKKSPSLSKKRKAPPPPPQRGCSISSIPSTVESESSGASSGGSPVADDLTTPDFRHVKPRVPSNGVVVLDVRQDADERYDIHGYTLGDSPGYHHQDAPVSQSYSNGRMSTFGHSASQQDNRIESHPVSYPERQEDAYAEPSRPHRPQSVPPIDLSFITQQPDSLDTIRSCSSGGTYSSATTFTSEPSSTEQTPRSTDRSKGHSSRSNNDSKRDTPRSKDLGQSHYSRSVEDVRGNAPLPPVSNSTTTQMIHGVDFGPLNSESSTDYLEASSDFGSQSNGVTTISCNPSEPEPEMPSLRAAMQKRHKTPKVYNPPSSTTSSHLDNTPSSRSSLGSTPRDLDSGSGSGRSSEMSTPRDAYGNPVAPPRSRSKSRSSSSGSSGSRGHLKLHGVVSDSSDTDALQFTEVKSKSPRSPKSLSERPKGPPPAPPEQAVYRPDSKMTNESEFDSVYSSDYDSSQITSSIASDVINSPISSTGYHNHLNQKHYINSVDTAPHGGIEMSSVPVISSQTSSTSNSQSAYSNGYISQSQTTNGYHPNHNHNNQTDYLNSDVIVQEDYEHGYNSALPIPHIPLDISDLTLDSPSEDESSVVNGFEVNNDSNVCLPRRPLAEWTSEDITDWCRQRDMLLFADIFDGSAVDGSVLLQIEESDLVDLEISDPSVRQQFMNELQTLRDNDKKRNKQDLDELESDVDEVMESVGHPPESRTHHNGDVSKNMYLGGSRDGIEITTERPLISWNTDEVMSWLQSSGLQKFMPTFEQHNINGRDLAEISMQLLDDIQIRTTEERELILSKLYELQNPSCPPLEAIMHEPPFVPSAPNSARSDDSNMSSSRSRGVKKRESFHKMKGLVPQKLFGSQEKNVVDITIWHDLLPDDSQSTDVKVDGSMSSYDVVKQVLERYDIIADSRLYYLVQIHVTDSGKDLVFQHDDHPLGIVQDWADDPSSYKIVLQCEKGLDIQLICRLPVSTSLQKLLSISSSTTCDDVIAMCVDIYGIPEEERDGVTLYTDDNPHGLTRVVGSTILSEHQSRSFIINNIHNEKQNESPPPPLPTYPPTTDKLDSLEEQMADIEASLLVKTSQLDTTELSMDSNNRSISEDQPIRREVSHGVNAAPPKMTNGKKTMITNMNEDVQSDEHLELLREIALMKDSISERDVIIHEYKMFNGALKEKADELSHRHDGMHNALAEQKQKEVNFHSTYVEMKHKLKVQKLQLAIVKGELDASVAQDEIHKRQLDVQEKVKKQQHMVDELQRQPGNVDKTFMQKSISMLKDLKREAMQLNTERQAVEQIRLFGKTDATSKSLSLSRVISAAQSERLFHLRIRRCRSGWGFVIGRDQRNLPMIRQREDDCPAEKGDVIVEMNGRTVISLPEQEIFKLLNEWSKPELSLLVIRSNEPITSSVSEEELRSVKEDLSLALLELESVQQENVDLSNHIKKSETLNGADQRKKQEMLYTIEQLKQQAATSRTQWKELREALKELRATDLRHHNLDPHILKLAGLEISPREEQTTSFEKRDSHHIINGHTSNLNGYVDEDNNKVIGFFDV